MKEKVLNGCSSVNRPTHYSGGGIPTHAEGLRVEVLSLLRWYSQLTRLFSIKAAHLASWSCSQMSGRAPNRGMPAPRRLTAPDAAASRPRLPIAGPRRARDNKAIRIHAGASCLLSHDCFSSLILSYTNMLYSPLHLTLTRLICGHTHIYIPPLTGRHLRDFSSVLYLLCESRRNVPLFLSECLWQ